MRPLIFLSSLFLFACGSTEITGTQEVSGNDSITEFDMNENKLSAVDFNNEMIFMQNGILDQIDALFASDSTNIDLNLENTLFEVELNLTSLENMKAPDGGEQFLENMKALMNFYKTEFTGPFNEIVVLLKKAEWTKEDDRKVKEFDERFAADEFTLNEEVSLSQTEFAKANNIQLELP
ncbi:MAG: hypothetical protein IPM77_12005 [Crocinitomicaceae bacterium]|nr:hypothetical protein [Crocinitomicaceae bacterium]